MRVLFFLVVAAGLYVTSGKDKAVLPTTAETKNNESIAVTQLSQPKRLTPPDNEAYYVTQDDINYMNKALSKGPRQSVRVPSGTIIRFDITKNNPRYCPYKRGMIYDKTAKVRKPIRYYPNL